jgi:hypothetical protein
VGSRALIPPAPPAAPSAPSAAAAALAMHRPHLLLLPVQSYKLQRHQRHQQQQQKQKQHPCQLQLRPHCLTPLFSTGKQLSSRHPAQRATVTALQQQWRVLGCLSNHCQAQQRFPITPHQHQHCCPSSDLWRSCSSSQHSAAGFQIAKQQQKQQQQAGQASSSSEG